MPSKRRVAYETLESNSLWTSYTEKLIENVDDKDYFTLKIVSMWYEQRSC